MLTEVFGNEDLIEFDNVTWNQCGDGGRDMAEDRRRNQIMGYGQTLCLMGEGR